MDEDGPAMLECLGELSEKWLYDGNVPIRESNSKQFPITSPSCHLAWLPDDSDGVRGAITRPTDEFVMHFHHLVFFLVVLCCPTPLHCVHNAMEWPGQEILELSCPVTLKFITPAPRCQAAGLRPGHRRR